MAKVPKAVADAKEVVIDKLKEIASAKAVLVQLESEHSEACKALRQAQIAADAHLPQCRMVNVRWRSGTEEYPSPVVILRRTPSGMLVVRRVGDHDGSEYRFKPATYGDKYVQVEKSSFRSSLRELRDVPAEYMPKGWCDGLRQD